MVKGGQQPKSGHGYFAFGLRIASELALPELEALQIANATPPDVTITFNPLLHPEALNGLDAPSPNMAILTVESVARYCIRDGREISIAPHPMNSERNIRLFLLGSAFGILCHQRGLLPLHANAIAVNRSVIAFAGAAGIGKSTLAAHFQVRGYNVLCDDVCVLDFDEHKQPFAYPGLPRLKLWHDAAETFGYDSTRLDRAIEGIDKYHVPLVRRPTQEPLPLKRLYILEDTSSNVTCPILRLTGTAAVQAILNNVYRNEFLREMGLLEEGIRRAVTVAKHIAVYAAPRTRGYDVFADEAERLERHIGLESALNDDPNVTRQAAVTFEGRKI